MSVLLAIVIASVVVLLALGAGLVIRARDGRRRSGGAVRVRSEDLLGGVGRPVTLVQFSTELCARCPQVRRLLGEIADERGIPFIEIDLTNRGDLASRYHVLQTPTTFLVDGAGAVLSRWGGVPDRRSIADAVSSISTLQEQP